MAVILHSPHITMQQRSHICLPSSLSNSQYSCGFCTFLDCRKRRSAKYRIIPCWTAGRTQGPSVYSLCFSILTTSMLADLAPTCPMIADLAILLESGLGYVPQLAKPPVGLRAIR